MKAATPGVRLFLQAIQSFFTTWALMKAGRMEPGNILTVVIFLLCLMFFCRQNTLYTEIDIPCHKIAKRTSCVLSIFFSLLYMAVDYPFYVSKLTNSLFRLVIMSAVFLGFGFLFYHLFMFLFFYTANISSVNQFLLSNYAGAANPVSGRFILFKKWFAKLVCFYNKYPGLCSFLLCMICWLPYFLYQFPGIMTPDSINQFEQVLDILPYSNHHPWIHTLLLKLIYSIGYGITGNMIIGISFYTFFQMTVMALTTWYFMNTLKKYLIRPLICFVITLFYAFVPYHAVFAVTIWKDILFAAAVLLFGCSMLRIIKKHTIGDLFIFVISGLMLCLFRSNGWYGFLLYLPFLLVYFRKQKKLMFPLILGIFLIASIFKYPVMKAYHVIQPDFIESLSIPTQQIAAVLCNDRELTPDQLELIENVVDLTYIKELYVPTFADNMKELVRAGHQDYLIAHKGDFFKLWIQLGLKYPQDYLEAYISQTYGYWYPDSFYVVAEGEGISATSLGISHTPLIRGPLVVKAKEISIKLGSMLPLYGTLWSMGVACWILLFCIGNTFVRGEKEKFILYLPSVALLLTVLIATPVATEFRYVYFMMFSLPFYIITAFLPVTQKQ